MKYGTYPNRLESITQVANDCYRQKQEALLRQLIEPSHEPIVCRHFGCGKHLSLLEQLHGNHCYEHQKVEKVDINKVLSY